LAHPLRRRHAWAAAVPRARSFPRQADQVTGVASPPLLYRYVNFCSPFGKSVFLDLFEDAADFLDDGVVVVPRRLPPKLLECVRSLVADSDRTHRCLPTTPSTCFAQRRSASRFSSEYCARL